MDYILCYKVIPLPNDTNFNGDIFGGWLLSQMDLAGISLCNQHEFGRFVTVTVNDIIFKNPVKIGNIIEIYGKIIKLGNTSITTKLKVNSTNIENGTIKEITEGIFKYVKIDKKGKPNKINKKINFI